MRFDRSFFPALIVFIAFFLFYIAGVVIRLYATDPQLLGISIPRSVGKLIYPKLFSWNYLSKNGYVFTSGSFTENKSRCNNSFCHFEQTKTDSSKIKGRIVVGFLDDLMFSKNRIQIKKENYKSIFSLPDDKTVGSIDDSYSLYTPKTLFNFRLIPKGNDLTIYGFNGKFEYLGRLGSNNVQLIEGNFDRIAFEVTPNSGIIRNAIKEIRFSSKQIGLLAILNDSLGKSAFILYHFSAENNPFPSYLKNNFILALADFNIFDGYKNKT